GAGERERVAARRSIAGRVDRERRRAAAAERGRNESGGGVCGEPGDAESHTAAERIIRRDRDGVVGGSAAEDELGLGAGRQRESAGRGGDQRAEIELLIGGAIGVLLVELSAGRETCAGDVEVEAAEAIDEIVEAVAGGTRLPIGGAARDVGSLNHERAGGGGTSLNCQGETAVRVQDFVIAAVDRDQFPAIAAESVGGAGDHSRTTGGGVALDAHIEATVTVLDLGSRKGRGVEEGLAAAGGDGGGVAGEKGLGVVVLDATGVAFDAVTGAIEADVVEEEIVRGGGVGAGGAAADAIVARVAGVKGHGVVLRGAAGLGIVVA